MERWELSSPKLGERPENGGQRICHWHRRTRHRHIIRINSDGRFVSPGLSREHLQTSQGQVEKPVEVIPGIERVWRRQAGGKRASARSPMTFVIVGCQLWNSVLSLSIRGVRLPHHLVHADDSYRHDENHSLSRNFHGREHLTTHTCAHL